MTLGTKQELFARLLGQLLAQVYTVPGRACRVGEVFRPPEMCRIYYERGTGILSSNHGKKLAVDLFISQHGKVTWDFDDYVSLGIYWEGLHKLCRWGGRMPKRRDAVHFSLYHRGVI